MAAAGRRVALGGALPAARVELRRAPATRRRPPPGAALAGGIAQASVSPSAVSMAFHSRRCSGATSVSARPLEPARPGASDAVHVAFLACRAPRSSRRPRCRRCRGRGRRCRWRRARDAAPSGSPSTARCAVVLRPVGVERRRPHALGLQAARHLVGANLRAHEDQHRTVGLAADEAREPIDLVARLDLLHRVRDGARRRPGGGRSARSAASRCISLASFTISFGIVAEKSSVCRSFGSAPRMRWTSGQKPMSSMRSASSSTSVCTRAKSTES